MKEEKVNEADIKTSWVYWLLPIFFAWIGGLIGWYILRDTAPHKGKRILIIGLTLTAIGVLMNILATVL